MEQNREHIRKCVINVLRSMFKGEGCPEIDDLTNPIADMGFISDDGLDFACEISDQLSFHFPDDRNPFVDDAGHRARRVSEIVDLVCETIPSQSGVPNG